MSPELFQCIETRDGSRCQGQLSADGDAGNGGTLACAACRRTYTVFHGVPVLRDARPQELELDKGYAHRDRAAELAQGWYRDNREFLTGQFTRLGVTGPTLEVGCGNGLLADALPGYVGLEYSINALLDPGWADATRVCGDAQVLPFKSNTFGAVVSINCLEHVPRFDQVVAELDRVVRPGGVLFLKPAWHCIRANTELIPIRPYSDLNLRQKIVKATLPLTSRRLYKFFSRVPWRAARRLLTRGPTKMKWTPLTPYVHPDGVYQFEKWVSDTDAAASLDSHETIMWFVRRGYACLSHPTVAKQVLAGHDWVILRKVAA